MNLSNVLWNEKLFIMYIIIHMYMQYYLLGSLGAEGLTIKELTIISALAGAHLFVNQVN